MFFKGPFRGVYIRIKICILKSARLILGGNMRLKIHWARLWLEAWKFMPVICSTFLLKLALGT